LGTLVSQIVPEPLLVLFNVRQVGFTTDLIFTMTATPMGGFWKRKAEKEFQLA
jgi:hypothetical protein